VLCEKIVSEQLRLSTKLKVSADTGWTETRLVSAPTNTAVEIFIVFFLLKSKDKANCSEKMKADEVTFRFICFRQSENKNKKTLQRVWGYPEKQYV